MTVSLRFDIDGSSYFVNTYENTSLQISKKVASLDNLSTQSSITKQTFRVPLTDELIDAIGDVSDPNQSAKINLNKKIDGQIYIDNIPEFDGAFQYIAAFKSFNSDAKEVEFLFDGTEVSLRKELEDVTMAELLDGETIEYTKDEIDTFLSNPDSYRNSNGYYWPLVDYGQRYTADSNAAVGTIIGSGQTALTQLNFKPSVTFEKLLNLMPVNITWDSSIDDLVERQTILLHNNESSIPSLTTSPRDYTGYMDRSSDGTQGTTSGTETKVLFNREYNYNQDQIDLPNDKYDVPLTGQYTLRIKGSFRIDTDASAPSQKYNVVLVYYFNPAATRQLAFATNAFVNGNSSRTFVVDTTVKINIAAGQDITLRASQTNANSDIANLVFLEDFRFEVLATPEINANSEVDVPANCPDLKAWDIFKTLVIQCNGIIEKNDLGVYNIIPWVEWIDSGGNKFLDNVIDPSKDLRLRPFSIQGAKTIKIKNEEGDDFYSQAYRDLQTKNYGDFEILDTGTDGTTRKVEKTIPFVSRPLKLIDGTSFPIITMYDKDFETIKGKPTLIQTYNTATLSLDFDLEDAVSGVGVTTSYSGFPYTGHWELSGGLIGGYTAKDYNLGQSLTFFAAEGYPNNTLYERFWKQYIRETYSENSRELTVSIDMPIHEVNELNFNETFYFKGSKFRLVEVENVSLTKRQPFTAKFMKRINIENIDIAPFYPYNVIDGIVQWKDSLTDLALSPPNGSSANQTDLEASANAYGFFYDSNLDIANQRGVILIA